MLTGLVGAAGGLGGFFLPTILGTARDAFGSYGPGIGAIAAVAAVALSARSSCRATWLALGRSAGMRTLVIGGGIAGQAVLEAIRERDPRHELTLACAEPRLPYDRVALSTLLASGADPDTLTLRPASWYEDHRIEVRLDTRVDDARPGYDRYVLCTGSRRARPADPRRRSTPTSSAAPRTARRSPRRARHARS